MSSPQKGSPFLAYKHPGAILQVFLLLISFIFICTTFEFMLISCSISAYFLFRNSSCAWVHFSLISFSNSRCLVSLPLFFIFLRISHEFLLWSNCGVVASPPLGHGFQLHFLKCMRNFDTFLWWRWGLPTEYFRFSVEPLFPISQQAQTSMEIHLGLTIGRNHLIWCSANGCLALIVK